MALTSFRDPSLWGWPWDLCCWLGWIVLLCPIQVPMTWSACQHLPWKCCMHCALGRLGNWPGRIRWRCCLHLAFVGWGTDRRWRQLWCWPRFAFGKDDYSVIEMGTDKGLIVGYLLIKVLFGDLGIRFDYSDPCIINQTIQGTDIGQSCFCLVPVHQVNDNTDEVISRLLFQWLQLCTLSGHCNDLGTKLVNVLA